MLEPISTWIKGIDESITGLRPGAVTTVTAYSGHLKTFFAVSQAYRASYSGFDTFVYFKGTCDIEIKERILALHANNPSIRKKFGYDLDIKYESICYDTVTDAERAYLIKVRNDLKSDTEGYGKIYYGDQETSLYDKEILSTIEKTGIDLIILDGFTEDDTNSLLKLFYTECILDKNPSLRVLITHQATYEAYRRATHNNGQYDIDAMKSSPDILRASKLIISLYSEPNNFLCHIGTVKITCLKNNYGGLFSTVSCLVNYNTGLIFSNTKLMEDIDNLTD